MWDMAEAKKIRQLFDRLKSFVEAKTLLRIDVIKLAYLHEIWISMPSKFPNRKNRLCWQYVNFENHDIYEQFLFIDKCFGYTLPGICHLFLTEDIMQEGDAPIHFSQNYLTFYQIYYELKYSNISTILSSLYSCTTLEELELEMDLKGI